MPARFPNPIASIAFLALLALFFTAPARAQTTAPAPKVTIDLADPQAALATYFQAQKANDQPSLLAAIAITDPAKKNYVEFAVLYQLWARYLERQAIQKFGKEAGITVEAHLRSLDDQTDLDLKRVKEANVQFSSDKATATLFLRLERGRPDDLQTDNFSFLDVYYLVKTAAGWQVDYLKTCRRFEHDADTDASCRDELASFPRMTRNFKTLADQLKSGKFKTADELKAALDDLWSRVYDQPTDSSGRTKSEAESQPATNKDHP